MSACLLPLMCAVAAELVNWSVGAIAILLGVSAFRGSTCMEGW